ncbi:MAG: sulfate ABC transporter permease subunit [Actinomycetota bacterium]|nr:sulfate ABC transporter permease subunit [Actinomycetota bacterium]
MSAQPGAFSSPDSNKAVRTILILLAAAYVGLLVLAPLGGIIWATARAGWSNVATTLAQPDVRHAYWLTAVITVITVVSTTVFGVMTAWVLARHRFWGRGLLNALVDLPMAVSPVIVGLMCVLLFGRGGWFEPFFASRGIQVIFALPAMILVTIFICIPFVIREVVPVLHEIGVDEEEASKTLGASSLQTFVRVTLPSIRWGLLYGVALSTARALGEIGAVLVVSGAIQGKTETATLYIFRAFEERQEPSAYLVALSLAAVSILLLVTIEMMKKHKGQEVRR